MSDWPWLFNDDTFAAVVERRLAEAAASRGEGAEALIARLTLDVPVYIGWREVKRWITEPFTDRFHEEVPGGDLGIRAAYLFDGDAALLAVKPDAGELTRKFMGTVVDQSVELGHLRVGTDEAKLVADIDANAKRFAEILDQLRADAAAHNASLAARIAALCAKA